MNNPTQHDLTAIAQRAAAIYGQTWEALPPHVRERWLQAVQAMLIGGGQTAMEEAARRAVDEWRNGGRVVQVVEPQVPVQPEQVKPKQEQRKTTDEPAKPRTKSAGNKAGKETVRVKVVKAVAKAAEKVTKKKK